MKQSRTLTPQEFVEHLASDGNGDSIEVAGFAKASEKPNCLCFAPEYNCDAWLDVPLSAIKTIEHFGRSKCLDHWHDSVRLTLAIPMEPLAALFANISAAVLDNEARRDTVRHQGPRPQTLCIPAPWCDTKWMEWDTATGEQWCSNCGIGYR